MRITLQISNQILNSFRSWIQNLKNHVQIVHEGKKLFPCKLCDKTFINRSALRDHEDNVHKGIKKVFLCEQCDRTFGTNSLVNLHKRRDHNLERYPCGSCDKAFTRRPSVREHTNSYHKGLKLYSCKLCEKSFSFHGSLKVHNKVNHGESKSYECQECSKTFTTDFHLKHHQQINTQFS